MAFDAKVQGILARRCPSVAQGLKKAVGGQPFVLAKEMAVLWAQTQVKTPRPNTLYIVSGFGEHLWALLPRVDASACVVVYEASLPRLKATLESQDLAALLEDERLHLFAGPVGISEFERLHQIPVARMSDVQALRLSFAWELDAKAYESFFAEFARQFEVTRRLHMTNFNDSLFWQAMTLKNIDQHYQAPDVECLKGLFSDLPVVLVGAGPSLDEAEPFLKEAKDRALIVAVNSSYRKLRNIGVKPHLVLAADPREGTAKGFEKVPTNDGPYLVAPFIANDGAIEAFAGRAFSWSGENNSVVQLVRKRLGLRAGTVILEKGTVSVSVADLAFVLGSRRLILVGQDMAIKSDGQTHVADSIYEGFKLSESALKTQKESPSGATKTVEGNTQPLVPTLNNLFTYLKIFEQWVELHPLIEVINTSRLGAKIKGAPYQDYDQVLEKLPAQASGIERRLQEAFERAPERKFRPEDWWQALRPTFDTARKVYQLALKGAVALEALPERFWQMSYKDAREVREIYECAGHLNQLIERNADDYQVLIEGRLKKTLLQYQVQLATLEGKDAFALELMRNREFFWALAEGVEPLVGLLAARWEPAAALV